MVPQNDNPENLISGRFGLDGCSKSPSCFDFDKLKDLNAHYIKECDKERLFGLVQKLFPEIAAFKDQVGAQTMNMNRMDAFDPFLDSLSSKRLPPLNCRKGCTALRKRSLCMHTMCRMGSTRAHP
jgi:hypothetical protein